MFTGLVEGLAEVASVVPDGTALWLTVRPGAGLPEGDAPPAHRGGAEGVPARRAGGVQIGESIAINGCCLTLVSAAEWEWSFQAGFETLAKTNLGRLNPGDRVNIERSLPVAGRLGGHFVQGHVDGLATIDRIERFDEWQTMWFRLSEALARGVVSKGSVAVDGVSLTVVDVDRDRFSVMLIPHTLQATTLGFRREGDAVNIETDILGKYVQKLLAAQLARGER